MKNPDKFDREEVKGIVKLVVFTYF